MYGWMDITLPFLSFLWVGSHARLLLLLARRWLASPLASFSFAPREKAREPRLASFAFFRLIFRFSASNLTLFVEREAKGDNSFHR